MDGTAQGLQRAQRLGRASMSQMVQVVSMEDVPRRLRSVSFQSKDVSGAQNSLFLFCAHAQCTLTVPSLTTVLRAAIFAVLVLRAWTVHAHAAIIDLIGTAQVRSLPQIESCRSISRFPVSALASRPPRVEPLRWEYEEAPLHTSGLAARGWMIHGESRRPPGWCWAMVTGSPLLAGTSLSSRQGSRA